MNTLVVNVTGLSPAQREDLLSNPLFVYCGRGSQAWPSKGWGNKFSVKDHGREGAIELHYKWLLEQVKSEAISKHALASLDGKVLGCHCAPLACHCDTLARAAAWAKRALAEEANPLMTPKAHRDFSYPLEFKAWAEREGLAENPRVLICGQRSFESADLITEVVAELEPGTVVIEGEARGADVIAGNVAADRGLPVAGFPARWDVKPHTPEHRIRESNGRRYDAGAGFLRNTRMLACEPQRVIALADFGDDDPKGGTGHTVNEALKAGIPVTVVSSDGSRRELVPS